MLEGLRQYLLSVTAAALLTAVLQALLPKGPVRRVTALACSLLMLLTVVRPLNQFNTEELIRNFENYCQELSVYPEEMEKTSAALTESIIVSKSVSYIEDKAKENDMICNVQVSCRDENGVAVPDAVTVVGDLTGEERQTLLTVIQDDFGLGEEAVRFTKEASDAAE